MKNMIASVAVSTLAFFSTVPAAADEQGLLLAMTLKKGEQVSMKPTLWSKIGSKASISADGALTIEVSSTSAEEGTVRLDIGVKETTAEGSRASRTTVTVPLEKNIRLQLGSDPSTSWIIEFIPRLTASPQRAAA